MRWSPYLIIALLVVAIGCGPTGETVRVTDRPDPPERTNDVTTERLQALADTIETGDFDLGRIWTFEDPPVQYFDTTYNFNADAAWFEQAQLGALRFNSYCSASFVSPNGLVMTNHHCGRESIGRVSGDNENLFADGFYAHELEDERQVPDLFVDKLVDTEDVTDQVYAATEDVQTGEAGTLARIRQREAQAIQRAMTQEVQEEDPSLRVEVTALNRGARYSAYTFRRIDDVRLVMAPEMQMGFFGGGTDNFTYPRFTLDFAFFRAYDEDGQPFEPRAHFSWSTDGVEEGDPVFAVGSPGGTQRHTSVSQLEFERDRQLPRQLEAMEDRMRLIENYFEEADTVRAHELQDLYFSLQNSLKSTRGQLAGLRDEELMQRRRANEQELRSYINASAERRERHARALPQLESLQRSKRSVAAPLRGYTFFGNTNLESPLLSRALYGFYLQQLRRSGATTARLDEVRQEALDLPDWPEELEEAFITQRFEDMVEYLGRDSRTVRRVLEDRSPEDMASMLVSESRLIDSDGYRELLEEGYMGSGDPSVRVAEHMASQFLEITRQLNAFQFSERELNAQLSRLRYEMRDGAVTPDATGTPRLSDGVISGYEYNGTEAPYKTTFFGLYDRSNTQAQPDWVLPPRWAEPPADLDQSVPLNIVSTLDISGGNSGSPLLNQNLEIVGVVFDSNIEALPNTYLFREEQARTIAVDARGIMEALEQVYHTDRLVEELRTGEITSDAPATPGME